MSTLRALPARRPWKYYVAVGEDPASFTPPERAHVFFSDFALRTTYAQFMNTNVQSVSPIHIYRTLEETADIPIKNELELHAYLVNQETGAVLHMRDVAQIGQALQTFYNAINRHSNVRHRFTAQLFRNILNENPAALTTLREHTEFGPTGRIEDFAITVGVALANPAYVLTSTNTSYRTLLLGRTLEQEVRSL